MSNSLHLRNGGSGFSAEMNVFPLASVPVLALQCSNTLGFMGHVGGTETECSDMPFKNLNSSLIQHQEKEEECFGIQNKDLSLRPGEELEAKGSSFTEKIRQTKLCARGHWRPVEDAKLKELVAQLGPQNWNSIAEHLPGRSGKSCRLRWFNQLDPRINRKAFGEEEEERLLNAHKVYGNKWAMISRLFPGRTDNAVKNHWHVIMARRQREKSCVFRRRKPTFQILPPKDLDLILPVNGGSESTISSTIIDESASTGTNLSFTPSLAKPTPLPFLNHCHVQNLQTFGGSLMGLSGEGRKALREVSFGMYFGGWRDSFQVGHMERLMRVDQSNYSESNSSEVSISESVATNDTTNLSISGENENMGNNKANKMIFIDFLGVGAA
ncbi:transcription factor MYB15-like [Vigna umbellata]|uniref:transcription factor MYB15-like n=2 Tax=Vigna umbellata TaxID=87088 RepID=UPI001F5E98C9|nr:transcription factor MYB15-like [Vigna umbellata]